MGHRFLVGRDTEKKRGGGRWLDSSHIGGFNGFVHITFFSPKSWEEICHPIFTGKRVCCSSVGFNCKGIPVIRQPRLAMKRETMNCSKIPVPGI